MGTLTTLSIPVVQYELNEDMISQSQIMLQLQDEIIMRFSELIADIEQGKLPNHILKMEISKLVDSQKEVFNVHEMKYQLFNRLFGYGILQPLIEDEHISDIDVLRYNHIVIKRNGEKVKSQISFEDEATLLRYCKLIVIRNGGILNEVDAHCRISDPKCGLRINATIKPRNTIGTTMHFRKHRLKSYTYEDLIHMGMLNLQQLQMLQQFNNEKMNILICGKGGAGKTTLMRTILEDVDEMERVLICESDQEIYPQHPNVIVQTIKKNHLGGIKRDLQMLIKDGLTMSLDTYCIGEITGDEAWDLVQAGLTDHRILATIHASSPEDLFFRMLTLVEPRTRISEKYLMAMFASSIDVIIYIERFSVKQIVHVIGYSEQEQRYILKECI